MAGTIETFTMRGEAAEGAKLTNWIVGVCTKHSLPRKIAFALQLCLEEAVANIIEHNRKDGPGATEIAVTITDDEAKVVMMIVDDGRKFDPTKFAYREAWPSLDQPPVGGLGIRLMRKFASDVTYERRKKRNWLHLVFARGG